MANRSYGPLCETSSSSSTGLRPLPEALSATKEPLSVYCYQYSVFSSELRILGKLYKAMHIVPFGMFYRIGGAPPETVPIVKYDAPEEVGGNRKCFDSPIRK